MSNEFELLWNKDYWEKFWNQRDLSSQNDFVFQELSAKVINKFIPNNSKVLVMGCGDGVGTNLLTDRGCEVTGIDISTHAIEKAITKNPKANFYVQDFIELDIENQYDVITLERILANQYTRERQRKVIENAKQAVKYGGLLIITSPVIEGYAEINKLRNEYGLKDLITHEKTLYLKEDTFDNYNGLKLENKYTFGLYSIISRVLYPALITPKEPKFGGIINKLAADLCYKMMFTSNLPSQHTIWLLRKTLGIEYNQINPKCTYYDKDGNAI